MEMRVACALAVFLAIFFSGCYSPAAMLCEHGTPSSTCQKYCSKMRGDQQCISKCVLNVIGTGPEDCCTYTYRSMCQDKCKVNPGSLGEQDCIRNCNTMVTGVGMDLDECAVGTVV